MGDARDVIMARIRGELDKARPLQRSLSGVTHRLQTAPQGPIPRRGAEGLDRFVEEAQAVHATLGGAREPALVADAVAAYLTERGLGPDLRRGVDPYLDQIPWSQQPELNVTTGAVEETDRVCLSLAIAGVAETGSVVLSSTPGSPAALNFLPETHIVLLPKTRLVGSYEEVWRNMRRAAGPTWCRSPQLPRLICWVTGPSRSADIEQTLVMGAHGPQRLHVILVGQ